MILASKIKHNQNFSSDLNIEKKIVNFAIRIKSGM